MASKIENVSQEEIARRTKAWYQVATEVPVDAEYPVEAYLTQETLADNFVAV
jgi:hypothetical protein